MPRHAQPVDRRGTLASRTVIVIVWLAGLGAGFYALLSIAARYGCGENQTGLACGNGGSALGVLLLLGVIATVTTVTVLVHGRRPSRTFVIGLCGVIALAACAVGSRSLLNTV